jgi:hypothetical protein
VLSGLIRFSENLAMPSVTFPIQDVEAAEEAGTQSVKAQQRLRELILAGHLPAGSRIAELALVERLGMSRTPIRVWDKKVCWTLCQVVVMQFALFLSMTSPMPSNFEAPSKVLLPEWPLNEAFHLRCCKRQKLVSIKLIN